MTAAKLFGVCLRILNDRREAEDVLQDVYLTIWQKAASFDANRASPITWLVAIARNRAIDRARSGAPRWVNQPIEAAERVVDPAPLASELLEAQQEHERLKSCLDEIEKRQSLAIRAAFLGGFTYEELAERAGVPLGVPRIVDRLPVERVIGDQIIEQRFAIPVRIRIRVAAQVFRDLAPDEE